MELLDRMLAVSGTLHGMRPGQGGTWEGAGSRWDRTVTQDGRKAVLRRCLAAGRGNTSSVTRVENNRM